MRYVQRKLLLLAASAAFALVYFGLQGYSFATEAAYCASYTVLVFGNALRKTGMGLISGEESIASWLVQASAGVPPHEL